MQILTCPSAAEALPVTREASLGVHGAPMQNLSNSVATLYIYLLEYLKDKFLN